MICGLVLAAGAGTRFGERSKLLAELDGRPLLEHAIAAQCAVGELERVAVVLGAFADEVLVGVDFMRAEPVVCERWEEGQALSLRRGIEYLTDGSAVRKVIVTLGDQPCMTPELIARFIVEPPGTRALYGGAWTPRGAGSGSDASNRGPARRPWRPRDPAGRQHGRMWNGERGTRRGYTRRPGGDTS